MLNQPTLSVRSTLASVNLNGVVGGDVVRSYRAMSCAVYSPT